MPADEERPVVLRDGRKVDVRPLRREDEAALADFGAALARDDWVYLDVELQDPRTVARLATAAEARTWRQLVAVEGRQVLGYATVRRMPGWKGHVGDVHLVVHPDHRRTGLGRALAESIIAAGRDLGVTKLVLEIAEDQAPGQRIFTELRFSREGRLIDHARDHNGRFHTLLIFSLRLVAE